MKNLVIAALMFSVVSPAQAIFDPSWERPVMTAEMKVTEARLMFEKVRSMRVTLTKRDGQKKLTGAVVAYKILNEETGKIEKQEVKLVIKSTETDRCGVRTLVAGLPQGEGQENSIGARFSLVLQNHGAATCGPRPMGEWTASVRQGYGWCGTFDATAEMYGNPEAVITIQSIQQ